MAATKACAGCGLDKPMGEFARLTSDQRKDECRTCLDRKKHRREAARQRATKKLVDRHRDEFEDIVAQELVKAGAAS